MQVSLIQVPYYDPDLDQDEKTLRAGLRIIELSAGCPGEDATSAAP